MCSLFSTSPEAKNTSSQAIVKMPSLILVALSRLYQPLVMGQAWAWRLRDGGVTDRRRWRRLKAAAAAGLAWRAGVLARAGDDGLSRHLKLNGSLHWLACGDCLTPGAYPGAGKSITHHSREKARRSKTWADVLAPDSSLWRQNLS